ncbi:MAG: Oxidoreductase, short chain dehydrogenase/reductase family protein [Candidatus Magasanikbacteria bacterium GW2011_GWA2_45_39]|uniref:Oxidoreductase, short chain dehydrogenase/reductase family protein n=1 Tax=Candidatus Magasanikbacteria bacterium GW2011_GWA2_45_39 TaxID=1619041 RepID=A0A0G1MHQ9_9BACT|nr:MAG: Oxidoreductase, short chain dehydrogenase/reductase family protein [Candidatus Magasanikbacteria bacterium GW2011_GWA2_45_39]
MSSAQHDQNYLVQLFSLNNQVVVLTGGLGKLGTVYAHALVKAGGRVAIFDRIDTPNDSLIELSRHYPLMFLKVDITDESAVCEAVQKVAEAWDVPTVLINNAGWRASPNEGVKGGVPFEDYSMDLWDDIFKINAGGAAICAKVIGGKMIADKRTGVIINIASHYALVAPDQRIYQYKEEKIGRKFIKDPPYGASKAALIALTRDLATQWAPFGIRVVALAPGGVFNPASDPEFVAQYSAHVPLGRMAKIDEYNGALIFLASDASSYMTGNCLVVDGGWTSW